LRAAENVASSDPLGERAEAAVIFRKLPASYAGIWTLLEVERQTQTRLPFTNESHRAQARIPHPSRVKAATRHHWWQRDEGMPPEWLVALLNRLAATKATRTDAENGIIRQPGS